MKSIEKLIVNFTDGSTAKYTNPVKVVMLKEVLWEINDKPDEYEELNFSDVEKIVNYAYDMYGEIDDNDINPQRVALFITREWDDIKNGYTDIEDLVGDFYDYDFDNNE